MHALIIFNPASGTAKRAFIDDVIAELKAGGADVELYLTQAANDATRYLKKYQGELDVVAAAGGDGTLNEVVNGLTERENNSWRLALIPTGTTNVLAGELGLKKTAKAVAHTILQGNEMPVYPGRINGRRFMLMAGVGYDAWVVDNVNLKLKKKVGKLAYVLSMLKQLPKFGSKLYRLELDGQEYFANSAIITNGRLYGGKFVISKQASLSAPTTQVLMLSGKSMWHLLFSLLGLPLGLMEKMPGVRSVAAKNIKIELTNQSGREPVQADGDSLAELPLSLEMEEQPLRLLVPAK